MTDDELHEAASRFRAAIERCRSRLSEGLNAFPHGSCGDASALLAAHLTNAYRVPLEAIACIRADRGEGLSWSSHTWIEVGGRIVDITADQYDEGMPTVFVGRESAWHDRFEVNAREEPDVALSTYSSELRRSYDTVVAALEAPT